MPLIKTRYGHKAVLYGSYSSCEVTPHDGARGNDTYRKNKVNVCKE